MDIRSHIESRRRFSSEDRHLGSKGFLLVCLISLIGHGLFFTSLFFIHDFEFFAPKPKIVTVDLVSFAPGPANAQTRQESSEPDKPVSDSSQVNLDDQADVAVDPADLQEPEIPVLTPDVSLKAKPDNLKELIKDRKEKAVDKPKKKKLTHKPKKDPEKELAKARKDLAKKLEKQNQVQLDQALERLKASVASKGQKNSGNSSAAKGTGPVGGGGDASPLTLYQMVIKSAIEQNWVFNDAMAGMNQDLEVRIFIKILKSGDIRDISFETKSGNPYLDDSAKKAVQRANPLPELPKGMSSYELILGFSPRGLK